MTQEQIERIIELTQEKKEILNTIESTEKILQGDDPSFYIIGSYDYRRRNVEGTRLPECIRKETT